MELTTYQSIVKAMSFFFCYRMKNKENYGVDGQELFHINELTFRCRKRDIRETDIIKYNGERYRITSLNVWPKDNEITMIIARVNE